MLSIEWWVQSVFTPYFTKLYSSLGWCWTLQWLLLCSWHITHTWSVWRFVSNSYFFSCHKFMFWKLTYVNLWHLLGNLDEHMHLVAPVLVRLFKVELVDIRRRAIITLTKLIPKVQVGWCSNPVWCIIWFAAKNCFCAFVLLIMRLRYILSRLVLMFQR